MKIKSCRCKYICLCLLISCTCTASPHTLNTNSSCALHYVDTKLKDFIKYAYALKEPSRAVEMVAQNAFKNWESDTKLVFLETTKPARSWNAFTVTGVGCTFVALSPLSSTTQKFATELFALYHEMGHIYHQHSMYRRITTLTKVASIFLSYTATAWLTKKDSTLKYIISLAFAAYQMNNFFDYTVEQEKEADLFACKQLKKENKQFAVIQQIKLAQAAYAHTTNSRQYNYPVSSADKIMRLTHPDWKDRADYLQECLEQD